MIDKSLSVSHNIRGDAFFTKYEIFFIYQKRTASRRGKKFFPGFYYWHKARGLDGPHHSINIAMSACRDQKKYPRRKLND